MADRRTGGLRERPVGPRSDAGTGAATRPPRIPAGTGARRAPSGIGAFGTGAFRLGPSTGDTDTEQQRPRRAGLRRRRRPGASARGVAPEPRRWRCRRDCRGPPSDTVGASPPRRRAGSRVLPVVVAVVVLGVVVGVAVALAPSHHPPAGRRSDSRHTTTTHTTHPQTTVALPPQVRPTTSTAATASYGAPSTGYTVGLQATGPCWVEATETSTGKVAWTGTLVTGQTQSIAATGNLLLRLGAANDVNITLNGEAVLLPTGFQSPFNMTFQSA